MLHQCRNTFRSCDLSQKRSISMLIYVNIRNSAYFTYKFDIIFGGYLDLFIKSVVSVYFNILRISIITII